MAPAVIVGKWSGLLLSPDPSVKKAFNQVCHKLSTSSPTGAYTAVLKSEGKTGKEPSKLVVGDVEYTIPRQSAMYSLRVSINVVNQLAEKGAEEGWSLDLKTLTVRCPSPSKKRKALTDPKSGSDPSDATASASSALSSSPSSDLVVEEAV